MNLELPLTEKRRSPNAFLLLFTGVLVVLGISAAFAYARFAPTESSFSPAASSTLETVAYFPTLSDIRGVASDPNDSHLLWVFNYRGTILQINMETQGVVDYTKKIHVSHITDLLQVGDDLFIALQSGGILKYNLTTGATNRYSQKDGLASDANISLTLDPSNLDTLWISTFKGLSKLTISTSNIVGFQSELVGTSSEIQGFEPIVFHIDDKYVWLTANANSYTNGGVARLDKKTGVWKLWGYEQFDSSFSRFDSFAAAADGDRAVVAEGKTLYSYDSQQDKWVPLHIEKGAAFADFLNGFGRVTSLLGNQLYYFNLSPKVLNIDTGIIHEVLSTETFAKLDIPIDSSGSVPPLVAEEMKFDSKYNRMILYPRPSGTSGPDNVIALFSLAQPNTPSVFPFSVLDKKFGFINTSLVDANKNYSLLNTDKGLVAYSLTKTTRVLSPSVADVTKIVGDKVVTLTLPFCGMGGCSAPIATTTVIALDTGIVDFETVLKTESRTFHIGTTLDDVYVGTYKLNPATKSYEDKGALPAGVTPSYPPFEGMLLPSRAANGHYTMSYEADPSTYPDQQRGDTVTISVQQGTAATSTLQLPVAPSITTNAFNNTFDQSISINDYSFDPIDKKIVWIGTNRGLIRLDMSTLTSHLYSTENGLPSNEVMRVMDTGANLVVAHPNGVYIYRL